MSSRHETTAPDLLAQAQAGDPSGLSDLYDRYHTGIFRFLYYRVGDRHTAEDLASETFIRVLRSLHTFRTKNVTFEAWLFRIARNLAIDHYRKTNGKSHLSLEEEMIADRDDPVLTAENNLTSDLLLQALSMLSEIQRDVVVLRFVNGLPITQVAQALHKSEDAVKALQRRALYALRETLTDWEMTYV